MFKKRIIFALLWSLAILISIGIPGSFIPKTPHFLSLFSPDKIIHLLLFSVWAVAFLFAFSSTDAHERFSSNSKIWVIVFGIVFGILTELLQFYVFIGRNGNVYDAIADIVGVVIGVFSFKYWKPLLEKLLR